MAFRGLTGPMFLYFWEAHLLVGCS